MELSDLYASLRVCESPDTIEASRLNEVDKYCGLERKIMLFEKLRRVDRSSAHESLEAPWKWWVVNACQTENKIVRYASCRQNNGDLSSGIFWSTYIKKTMQR